ncbi:MAG: DUF6702 family protein [Flavobacteriales bacterium]
MKLQILLFFALLTLVRNSRAHEYHFAFMELEYYPSEQQFQATLKVTAHDLAYIFSKKHGKDLSVDQILKSDSLYAELSQFICGGFTLFQNNQAVYFKVDGNELSKNGDLIFYLSSEQIEHPGKLTFTFPLLTLYFPTQQNKLDYLKKGTHYTLSFLSTDYTKEIPVTP